MLLRSIPFNVRRLIIPTVLHTHTETCPARRQTKCEEKPKVTTCPSVSGKGAETGSTGGGIFRKPPFKRALHSGPVRLGFIPDNWFTFFHNKTGVTGPYLFLFTLANYLVSKEIYVMEHEYYLGLSAFVVIFYTTKTFGKDIAAALDKQVDTYAADLEKGRQIDLDYYNNVITMSKEAQRRAEGQKMLMDAKKENVAMQLESIYRERAMLVYRSVRGRMDYQIRLYQAEARIQQKWMLGWILENVHKSITPEFLKQAMSSAIDDLSQLASHVQAK